jgi:hypothetical protein
MLLPTCIFIPHSWLAFYGKLLEFVTCLLPSKRFTTPLPCSVKVYVPCINISLFPTSRLVSKLSLSVQDRDGFQQLFMLERVLQVFTPELVECIDQLVYGFKTYYFPLQQRLQQTTAAHRFGGGSGGTPGMQRGGRLSSSNLSASASTQQLHQAPDTPPQPQGQQESTAATALQLRLVQQQVRSIFIV